MGKPPRRHYFGSTVVGEKGQIVVPAEARRALGLEPGDKVMVFGEPYHGELTLMRADVVAEYVHLGREDLDALAQSLAREGNDSERSKRRSSR